MTRFAPVPEFARGPDIPAAGCRVTELGGGAYGITSGLVTTMFLVTRHVVVVEDAPPDLGGRLLTGIEEVTTEPVTHLIYSHAHADHIGSAQLQARDGLKIIAHELTARFIREANDDNRPLPSETFSGTRSELSIGGERLVLEYTGTGIRPATCSSTASAGPTSSSPTTSTLSPGALPTTSPDTGLGWRQVPSPLTTRTLCFPLRAGRCAR